ncbi:hypothetical protein JHK82_033517 [Glycine max]|nr:hypothetical protein JHK87_033450 [Glycine soja]KAG4980277.1 hypothetical protein JHK85_034235 [Glycine max]KAG5119097.1 hypothetical protein JHK82_033517 [Glycine max]
MVSKVLIDQGNSINTMYWKTVQRLEVSSDTIHPYAVYKKPKVYPWYALLQNPWSALGTYSYKTQGTPLVRSLAATSTTIRGEASQVKTTYHQIE